MNAFPRPCSATTETLTPSLFLPPCFPAVNAFPSTHLPELLPRTAPSSIVSPPAAQGPPETTLFSSGCHFLVSTTNYGRRLASPDQMARPTGQALAIDQPARTQAWTWRHPIHIFPELMHVQNLRGGG